MTIFNSTDKVWAPRGQQMFAVKITPGETLTWDQFLDRLGESLETLVRQEGPDGREILDQEIMLEEGREIANDGPRDLIRTMPFEEILNEVHGINERLFPVKVEHSQDALETFPEDVATWVGLAMPHYNRR